jgi:hypothetical protein
MTFDRGKLPDALAFYEGEGLQLKGPPNAPWKTTECRIHGGSDSMRVHVASGAFKCMNCGAAGGDVLAFQMQVHGLGFVQAAKALGAWLEDGRPQVQTKSTPLSPRLALSVMAFESTLTAVAAANVANGVILTDADRARLMVAANRIIRLVEAYQ